MFQFFEGEISTEIVFGTFLLAVMVVLLCYLIILKILSGLPRPRAGSFLVQPMGTLKWSFSESWTTSLTAIGALLGMVLDKELMHQPTTMGLSLFFGLLILVTPIIYRATAKPVVPYGKPEESELQGIVATFLLTSLITLWAVFGELIALIAIINDLSAQGFFAPFVHYIVLFFLGIAMLGTMVYALRTIPWIAQDQMLTALENQKSMQETLAEQPGWQRREMAPALKPWAML